MLPLLSRNLRVIYKPTSFCANRAINHIYTPRRLPFGGLRCGVGWGAAGPGEAGREQPLPSPNPPPSAALGSLTGEGRFVPHRPDVYFFKYLERAPACVPPHCVFPIRHRYKHTTEGFLLTESTQRRRMVLASFLEERRCPSNNP